MREKISKLKRRKAVYDRIPNEAVREIWEAIGQQVVELFQKCWAEGVPQGVETGNIDLDSEKDGNPIRAAVFSSTWGRFWTRRLTRDCSIIWRRLVK